MNRRALLAVGSLDSVGGAQYVNRLLRAALLNLDYDVRCRTLLDGPSWCPPQFSRFQRAARFVLGAHMDRRWRPSLLLADHARIAYKARLFRAQRATKVVFAHGIEVWTQFEPHVQDTFRRSDFILCNSQFTRGKIIDMYDLDPDRCVHVALGANPIRLDAEPAVARTNEFIVLGRIAAEDRYKGHDELLLAWPYVLEQVPDAVLRIIGGGNDVPRLKRLACELSLDAHVFFEGVVDEERKHALLRKARGLFMLSTGEGFGLASVEAMALGAPVVGLEETVTAELVNDGVEGLLLPNRTPESIAYAVTQLTHDVGYWQHLSRGAHARWQSEFSKDACLQRLRAAFVARLPELQGLKIPLREPLSSAVKSNRPPERESRSG